MGAEAENPRDEKLSNEKLINSVKEAMEKFYPEPEERNKIAKYGLLHSLWYRIFSILKRKKYSKSGMDNWSVSVEVHDRLVLRYAILSRLEGLESNYKAFEQLLLDYNKKSESLKYNYRIAPECVGSSSPHDDNPYLRSYRLAATDLFVEKAIAYLEIDCDKYTKRGVALFYIGIFIIIIGMIASCVNYFGCEVSFIRNSFLQGDACRKSVFSLVYSGASWIEFLSKFAKGFTFYGLIVLSAVGCWRLGRAMMDQAERLRERRHSLRQGRLFIHLNNGNVTIEQLEKAFDWNVSKGNAFANIETEASAPWGGLLKEALRVVPEVFKNLKNNAPK